MKGWERENCIIMYSILLLYCNYVNVYCINNNHESVDLGPLLFKSLSTIPSYFGLDIKQVSYQVIFFQVPAFEKCNPDHVMLSSQFWTLVL
jgi:hypothetical protein